MCFSFNLVNLQWTKQVINYVGHRLVFNSNRFPHKVFDIHCLRNHYCKFEQTRRFVDGLLTSNKFFFFLANVLSDHMFKTRNIRHIH